MFAFTEPDKGGLPVKVIINPDVAKSHGVKAGDRISYLDLTASPGVAANQATPWTSSWTLSPTESTTPAGKQNSAKICRSLAGALLRWA